ncbi:MAG: flagellar biosynthesis protein FlhA [Treponema sp.]|jgi:flagellar biosynthesis protein FlhA|nr:flagellar biosynthesis protein FlhA [Treponema sp.]
MADTLVKNQNRATTIFGNGRDMFIAIGVVLVTIMIVIPLPTVMLDALQALNFVLSLLVLLIVLYTKKATDFSIFPTVLLVLTVFSLALNVSSTRLILTMGSSFDGRMIRAFSTFVVGSSGAQGVVVGFIIFIVIIAVQVVVITKGATRISEVAARFALDAMPGKQMSIDAEYSSGSISEEEARTRKQLLQQEVDFYGAMDGSSKFISGNVKIGIFITVVNILGGIIIGVAYYGEPISSAISTYIAFSIGDGLLAQLPALLISTATGIVVTRSVSNGTLGEDVAYQFSRDARIYWVSAFVLAGFSLLPGFPWYVLVPLAVLLGFLAFRLSRGQQKEKEYNAITKTETVKKREEQAEMSPIVPLDALSLELGYGLIPLVDRDRGAELLERVQGIRRQSALELGLVIPKIRIIDNIALEPSEYCFKIRGVDVGRGKIRMNCYLCIKSGFVREEIAGEKTRDPTFGLPAVWINEERRDEAERAGYTVVDPPSIIATHLTEIIKTHASEILGRQETQAILDTIKKEYPAVVEEILGPKALNLGEIQKVLQGLLKEQVSIRNMVSILEALADYAPVTRDTRFLTEKARQALSRQICHKYADDDLTLRVLTLEQTMEQKIVESRVETSSGVIPALEPSLQNVWIKAVSRSVAAMQEHGWEPVILCSEAARYLVKASTERELPELVVLSVPEISSDIALEAVGVVRC